MGLPGGRRQLLSSSFTASTSCTLFRFPAIKRPLPSTKGALAGSVAFPAGMGSRLGGVDDALAGTPMAKAGAQAEGADVCAGGQESPLGHAPPSDDLTLSGRRVSIHSGGPYER
jgi:hypothetical protein